MSERKDAQLKLGQRLKQARTAAGYTQQQAAELLKLSRPTIADIESGRRRGDSLLLRDLAGSASGGEAVLVCMVLIQLELRSHVDHLLLQC